MSNIEKSRKYLKEFIEGHIGEYSRDCHEYRGHKGYSFYSNYQDFERCMAEIVYHIDETFGDLRIPQNFVTAEKLIETAGIFINLLKKYDETFNKTIEQYSKETMPSPIPVIYKARQDTIRAFETFIKKAQKEIEDDNSCGMNNSDEKFQSIDIEKMSIKQILPLLSIKSLRLIGGIFASIAIVLVGGTWKICSFVNERKISLAEELKNTNIGLLIQIDSLKVQNQYLIGINAKLKSECDNLHNYNEVHSKKVKASISYNEPESLFDGNVLVMASNKGLKNTLSFKGIKGISHTKSDSFKDTFVEVHDGDRFYIMLEDNSVWTVNILSTTISIDMELLPI